MVKETNVCKIQCLKDLQTREGRQGLGRKDVFVIVWSPPAAALAMFLSPSSRPDGQRWSQDVNTGQSDTEPVC